MLYVRKILVIVNLNDLLFRKINRNFYIKEIKR